MQPQRSMISPDWNCVLIDIIEGTAFGENGEHLFEDLHCNRIGEGLYADGLSPAAKIAARFRNLPEVAWIIVVSVYSRMDFPPNGWDDAASLNILAFSFAAERVETDQCERARLGAVVGVVRHAGYLERIVGEKF